MKQVKNKVRVTYWFVFSEFSAANGFNVNWNNNGNFNLNGNNAKSNSNTNNRGVRPVIACSSCSQRIALKKYQELEN
jgi:hypothetical protein